MMDKPITLWPHVLEATRNVVDNAAELLRIAVQQQPVQKVEERMRICIDHLDEVSYGISYVLSDEYAIVPDSEAPNATANE